ncbi:MAG: hypothetical protein ACMUIG_02140 [Thermoplasmatota archaeon]
MKNETGMENAADILMEAERALTEGRFFKARKFAHDAGVVIDRTQGLHRKFMNTLKKMMEKVLDMEDRGYDVSEARRVLEGARNKALQSNYKAAITRMKKVEPALNRATYTPFPLLNKTVNIISSVTFEGELVNYNVRVENPTDEPLGEIIITPFLPREMFHEVPERFYGMIGPREFKESTFQLKPKGKEWSVGIGQDVIRGEGVVMQTVLSSKKGEATYRVIIENNSDQILRDIRISPMTPGGLEPDPSEALIDHVEPFASRTFEFILSPGIIRTPEERPAAKDKVVVIQEEVAAEVVEALEVDDIIDDEEEEDDEGWEESDEDEDDITTPRDFTPVQPEYNLISMSDYAVPESVNKRRMSWKKNGSA